MKTNILFSIFIVFFSINCAVFRGGLQEERKKPIQIKTIQENKPSVFGTVNGNVVINDEAPAQMQQNQLNNWAAKLGGVLNESKIFSSLAAEQKDADYIVEMNLTDKSKYNQGLAFLTGLTLYLFPSSAEGHVSLKTTFKNKKGDILGTIEKQETYKLWQQILLIFVMPFKFPSAVLGDIQTDMIHFTIQEAEDKGFFSSTKGNVSPKKTK